VAVGGDGAGNQMRALGAERLAEALQQNSTLTSLYLEGTQARR